MIQDPIAILSVLLATVLVSLHLAARYEWAKKASPVMLIIFGAALCSNLGLIPTEAPLYGAIAGFAVPFAVSVILFTVNLRDVLAAGRPMLAAFVLAALATALGVVLATVSLAPLLAEVLGDDSWKLAGPYTGTYVGGSLNFVALWEGLEIDSPDLFAAANAVDNLSLFPLYALWVAVPVWLAGRWKVADRWAVEETATAGGGKHEETPPFDLRHIVTICFLAVAVVAASNWLKVTVVDRFLPALPTILIVTTLALALGQIGTVRRLQGAWQVGDLAFFLFFAAIGALIDFYKAVVLSPVLFAYVLIVILVHFGVLYGVGGLLKMDLGVLTIASVATKAGPPLVPPMAEGKGWRHLVLPGIVIGMFGYAIGNYVGLATAHAVRLILGG